MKSKRNWTAITCCTIHWRTRKSTWTRSSHCWPQSTIHSVNQWRVRPAKENSSSKWRKSSLQSGKTRIRYNTTFKNIVFKKKPFSQFSFLRFPVHQIEKQIEMLTEKHHDLGRCLGQFAVEEHQYRDTLKAISHESQKYKQLMSQLNDHND